MISAVLDSAPNLTRLQRRRLSWRVAQGAPLQQAAARAGLTGGTADALLVCPDFAAMVEDYRAMAALSVEERVRRLVEAALMLLEEAMRQRDPRACFFILKQQLLGRCPARELARGVVRALERPPPTPKHTDDDSSAPPAEPTDRRPVPAIDRAAYGAATSLREDILDETEALADVPVADSATGWSAGGAQQEKGWSAGGAQQEKREGIIWSQQDLEKIEDLGSLLHHDLSERQLILIAEVQMERERLARTDPTGEPPHETDPMNPNAPNE